MVESEYKHSKMTVGGYYCIEHRDNPNDIKVWGLRGYLYPAGLRRYAVVIFCPKILNAVFKQTGHLEGGSEKILYIGRSKLRAALKTIRAQKDQDIQIALCEAWEGTTNSKTADVSMRNLSRIKSGLT